MRIFGAINLFGMMVLTCTDVLMRFFGHPILGSEEITSFMAILMMAGAMPYTHYEKGHIGVNLIIRKFPKKTQARVDLITSMVSFLLFAIITWQTFIYAEKMKNSGEVSMTLEFPLYILVYAIAAGFIVLSLSILLDIIQNIKRVHS